MRIALVQIVADHLDGAGLLAKAIIELNQLVRSGVQALFDAHAHDLAQLGHRLGGPVIVAHQGLASAHGQLAALRRGGAVAKGFGHGGLQVKDQPVLMAAGSGMQAGTDQAEQGFVGFELLDLEMGDQVLLGQLMPAVAEACGLGQPEHGVQIAQPAGRFLAVGLQRIGREVVFGVALAHFQQLAFDKSLGIELRAKRLLEVGKQGLAAGDAA